MLMAWTMSLTLSPAATSIANLIENDKGGV
uniref:Uncharacterized protein n=1 Tax=Nelumbo nucifera TaxID=4432 RepID=A0A822ZI86_NELNU|nr:TPA_asm: hypothetical protein HUJ06_001601 [Nelumbo nucifera]